MLEILMDGIIKLSLKKLFLVSTRIKSQEQRLEEKKENYLQAFELTQR